MKILKGTLLLWLVAALAACAVGPRPQDPRYVRDGKAYGVTKGLFRSRWWNFYERGASFSDGKFWREAEDDLRTALRLRSKDQRRARTYGLHFVDYFPHRELGVVLYQQERYEESVKELTTSLETVKTARAEFYLDRARKALIQARGQDTGAPVIVLESPAREEVLSNSLKWTVSGTVRDDTLVKEVSVNGIPVRVDVAVPEVPFRVEVDLKGGANPVAVLASDLAGNTALVKRTVFADRSGPVLSLNEPTERTIPGPNVRLKGFASDDSLIASIVVNGRELLDRPRREVVLDHPLDLSGQRDRVRVEAADEAGNRTLAEIRLEGAAMADSFRAPPSRILLASLTLPFLPPSPVRWAQSASGGYPPTLEIQGWTEDQTVLLDQAYLQGRAFDDGRVETLAINNRLLPCKPARNVFFNHLAPLEEGDNAFTLEGRDDEGNLSRLEVRIHRRLQEVRDLGERLRVLVLPFEIKGEPGAAAEVAEDAFLVALDERERFDLVERTRLDAILEEQKLSLTDLADPAAAVRPGKILTAHAVLVTSVLEKPESLEMFCRLVDVESAGILAAVDVYGENVDSALLRRLCAGLVLKLCDEIPLVEGLVVQVKGRKVTVDLGKASKVKKGMPLVVFREGEPIVHPVTGKELGADVESLGEARIEKVRAQVSQAEMVEDGDAASVEPMARVITR